MIAIGKGNSDMERNTVKEYTIRTATEEESDSIITLLKEVAQWLQYKEVSVAVSFRRGSYG